MTPTEHLRASLQERGIEFYEYDMGHIHGVPPTLETTWTAASGLSVTYVECPGGATRMRVWEPSASQALDMAGRGECHMTLRENIHGYSAYLDTYECDVCGEQVERGTVMGKSEPPKFCPECGRRVVE